jgi:DNA-binding beta-propeller fold protein YncE
VVQTAAMATSVARRAGIGLLAASYLLGLAGCSSTTHPKIELPAAAEPSIAAVPTTRPAGRIVQLPAKSAPEGVAEDPVTHEVVVALRNPDRVALINTRSLRVRVRPAPGKARHLILIRPGGPVLLPAEDMGTVFELSLPSGRVIQATKVLRQPHNAAVVGKNIWVADELAPAISVVNLAGRVIATLHGPVQPGGVVTAAGTVGVTDVRGARMYFYNAATFDAEGSIPLGTGPTHAIAAGGNYAVAADTRGGALLLVNMATRRVVSRLSMPGGPYGLASDPATGDVWVTITEFNQLVRVSVANGAMRVTATMPTVQQPNTVAVDPNSHCTYVAGVTTSVLDVICPNHPLDDS